jgi:hypothetical protein
MSKKIYLAIPYSGMEEESFRIANEVTSKLMLQGHIVFSPISHSHPIAISHQLPGTWEFWKKFDESFIEWCDELHAIVIGENGMELMAKSKGVTAEIEIAKSLNKPIGYVRYGI